LPPFETQIIRHCIKNYLFVIFNQICQYLLVKTCLTSNCDRICQTIWPKVKINLTENGFECEVNNSRVEVNTAYIQSIYWFQWESN
jgi:hypothetical protein